VPVAVLDAQIPRERVGQLAAGQPLVGALTGTVAN
jgi:hypothetical protein